MAIAARIVAALVALAHGWFLVLEMFLWNTPFGRKTFGTTEAFAKEARALAANQGLYNGFLAAGIAWALISPPALWAARACFFLGCVVVAGIFGAATASKRILFLQALPGAVALDLILVTG